MMISVITLATAIGAAAATWSLLSAVLLNPLPVRDPERLAMVGTTYQSASASRIGGATYPYYRLVNASGVFDSVAGVWLTPLPLPVNNQTAPDTTPVEFVSRSFFDVLGIAISVGRGFAEADDRRGAPVVAVLSDRYWRTMFAADPAVLGRPLAIGKRTATIVGVAPRGFRGLSLAQAPAIFLPLETIADVGSGVINYFAEPSHQSSPTAGVGMIGRLRAGETFDLARVHLDSLSPPSASRGSMEPLKWAVIDIRTAAVPATAREGTIQFARLMAVTVALLVLIGCATVGLLLVVGTEARREEFATCLALGATRTQLARGVILEGAMLTLAASAVSPLIAWWLCSAVSAFQLPGGIVLELLDLSLDRRTLAVIVASGTGMTLLIGMIGVAFGFRADIGDAIRARSGVTPRFGRGGTRAVLLATQVAIALALIAGTGLFARSLMAALDLNRGIDSARIVIHDDVPLAAHGYSPARAAALFDGLRQRLAGNPFVESVATSETHSGMSGGGTIMIGGRARIVPTFVPFRHVDDNYFTTMRMSVRNGRHFLPTDVAGAPVVGIVSDSFARLIAPGGDVLGQHIEISLGAALDITIVGVVNDLFTDIRDAQPLAVYMPITQPTTPIVNRTLVFRATNDVGAGMREVLDAIRELDPNVRPSPGLTLNQRLMRQMAPQQFGLLVFGSLGAIALLLTILGTYVLAETAVVLRTRELGIRAALGATRKSLTMLVVRESASLTGFGLCGGLLISWTGASTIRAFLLHIQPLDPFTLGAVAVLILLVSVGGSMRPALRAASVDLAQVLKSE